MFLQHFANIIYIKVYENRFVLKLLDAAQPPLTIQAAEPFSTPRLLLGQFMAAERTLKKAIKDLLAGKWFAPSPIVVIQPMEKLEGGLSEVEERALRELALAAGARKVIVWTGHELADSEVLQRAHNAK